MYYITYNNHLGIYSCFLVNTNQSASILHDRPFADKGFGKCNFRSLKHLLSADLVARKAPTKTDLQLILSKSIHSQETLPTMDLLNTNPELFI